MNTSEKKQLLRKEMLKKRAQLSEEDVASAEKNSLERILQSIFECKQASGSSDGRQLTVMSYMSYRNEFPTHRLNHEILSNDCRLVLPFTDENFNIIPCYVDDMSTLKQSDMGIFEPDPAESEIIDVLDIDVILMPGVAFDIKGSRIGFGKGCYDRMLADASEDTGLIALAYDFQVSEMIPAESSDVPCDIIITEKQTIRIVR